MDKNVHKLQQQHRSVMREGEAGRSMGCEDGRKKESCWKTSGIISGSSISKKSRNNTLNYDQHSQA